jgi:hypothetical protein
MKREPDKEKDEMDAQPHKKKEELGYNVRLLGFLTRWEAMKHLVEIKRGNTTNLTDIKFSVVKKEGYHIVQAFIVGVFSEDQAKDRVLKYLINKISKDYVK